MILKLLNFRGIKNAEIETKKITLLAGHNHAGKTSAINGFQVALTEMIYPVANLTKKTCGNLIHNGNKKSYVSADFDAGSITVAYPELKRTDQGDVCAIDNISAGIENLVDMSGPEIVQYITEIMDAKPKISDLRKKLDKIEVIDPDKLSQLIKTVETLGWDEAHKLAKQGRTKLTGAWEQVTGERFGSAKADGWRPAEWDISLESTTAEELSQQLAQEREWLQAAQSQDAVDAQEVARLKTESEGIDDYLKDSDGLTHQINALLEKSNKIKSEIATLRKESQSQNIYNCPGCGESLVLRGGELVKYTPPTSEEIESNKQAMKKLQDDENRITRDMAEKSEKLIQAKAAMKTAQEARDRLKKIENKPTADTSKIEDCRNRVRSAEEKLRAKQTVDKADLIYAKYLGSIEIIEILAPDGMRKDCATGAIRDFNKLLETLSRDTALWSVVKLEPDMSFSFGGRAYELCSESEKYRCRVTIQYAVAGILNSPYVLIDGADILDIAGRNSLFMLAKKQPAESVISMTMKKMDIPPVDKIGGVAYWIDQCQAERL